VVEVATQSCHDGAVLIKVEIGTWHVQVSHRARTLSGRSAFSLDCKLFISSSFGTFPGLNWCMGQ